MTPCVCGCPYSHDPHCVHGCTLDTPDDGDDHGGSVFSASYETYNGRYGRRFEW